MKINIFACFLLFGVALATPRQPDYQRPALFLQNAAITFDGMTTMEKIETIDEFVDMVLTEAGYLLVAMKMDPLDLPEISQKISGGSLNMTDGLLQGASKIYRDGDVLLNYEDRQLNTDISMIFRKFQLDYDYNVKLWAIKTNGTLNGTVHDIKLNFKIDVDFKNLHITLVKFEISEIEDIKVKFEGGVLGSIANVISGLVTGIFKGMITDMLSTAVGGTLVKVIDEINKVLYDIKHPTPPPPEQMLFNKFIFKNLA